MKYAWIQLILLAGIGTTVLAFVRRWDAAHTRAWKRLAFGAFVVANIFAVFRPEDVTWVANRLGVGRGTDLVLYLLVVAVAFVALNTFMRFRSLEMKLTDLARSIALAEGERLNGERFDLGPESTPPGDAATRRSEGTLERN